MTEERRDEIVSAVKSALRDGDEELENLLMAVVKKRLEISVSLSNESHDLDQCEPRVSVDLRDGPHAFSSCAARC